MSILKVFKNEQVEHKKYFCDTTECETPEIQEIPLFVVRSPSGEYHFCSLECLRNWVVDNWVKET